MKRIYLAPLGALILTMLTGCGAQTSAKNPARGIAAAFVAGRAYDDSQNALKRGDGNALKEAGRQFARASSTIEDKGLLLRGVIPLSVAGTRLEAQAKIAPRAQRAALLARALEKYRAASAFLPANPKPGQVDANTLNMVGYPLADRGQTRADWERALQLTRLSLAQWDEQIKQLPPASPERLQAQADRATGALDSYAWALFRLGRTAEALQKQERVIEFALKNPAAVARGFNAEIPYHMAEIYRAAGREEDAQKQYEFALSLNPDPELVDKIDIALNAASV